MKLEGGCCGKKGGGGKNIYKKINNNLGPNFHYSIPSSSTECTTIARNSNATNSFILIMSINRTLLLSFQSVPDMASIIISVGGIKKTSTCRESNRIYRTGIIVSVHFTPHSQVEKSASKILRAGGKSVSVRHETRGVDIFLVSLEDMSSFSRAYIPCYNGGVARGRNEMILLWVNRDVEYVVGVVFEVFEFLCLFNIPESTSVISGTGNNLSVIDEATAREEAVVSD